jgi:hypothetical protein
VAVSGMLSGSGIWLAGMIELGHVLLLSIFLYCLGTPDLVALCSDTALVDAFCYVLSLCNSIYFSDYLPDYCLPCVLLCRKISVGLNPKVMTVGLF